MLIDLFSQASVPLWEAAAFTCGCALVREQSLDQDRVGMVLIAIAALLTLAVLLVLMPGNPGIDPDALDPGFIWPHPI